MAVIVRDGIRRMYGPEPEDCFYYLTLYNENYVQPPIPVGADGTSQSVEDGIVQGIYRYRAADGERAHRAQILASGPMVLQALEAQQMLAEHHDVAADVWSVTSWKQLRDNAIDCERWNRLHPTDAPRAPYVTQQLDSSEGPVVAVSDWVKAVPDTLARFVPQPYVVLGTDGYGYSDTRASLRRHFEVDAAHITVAVLDGLAQTGDVKGEAVAEALRRYEIETEATPDRRTACASVHPDLLVGGGLAPRVRPAAPQRWWSGSQSSASSSSSQSSSSSSSSLSPSSFTSASVPEPSVNKPSSNPCLSLRASRKRRARPFLGTSSPASKLGRAPCRHVATGERSRPPVDPDRQPRCSSFSGRFRRPPYRLHHAMPGIGRRAPAAGRWSNRSRGTRSAEEVPPAEAAGRVDSRYPDASRRHSAV